MSTRRYRSDLEALTSEHFDILVIGGGVIGAGAALDAASRGLKVALVEAQDWAAGSSSHSSKLIHGGLRYLEQRDFALVREALRERSILMRTAPHLVHPVPFVLPLRRGLFERAYVAAGLVIYDALARTNRESPQLPFHRQLSRRGAKSLVPALSVTGLSGAIQYWDAQVDDARHTLSLVRTAASFGAVVANRVSVTGLVKRNGRVSGALVRFGDTGEAHEVRATAVVSATGVWTEGFATAMGVTDSLRLAPSKGVHLVVPRQTIDSSTALIVRTSKSVLFVLPWGEHWIVGTTDTAWVLDVNHPAATATDVNYILSELNSVLAHPIRLADIESVFVGLRPLIASPTSETTEIPREHSIASPSPGLVMVAGGKYTTYRVIANEVIDTALALVGLTAPQSHTAAISLVGADRYAALRRATNQLRETSGLGTEDIQRLLGRYGGCTIEVLAQALTDTSLLEPLAQARGYLRVEIAYAVTHEGARHLDDVLMRRTRLSIEARDRGVAAAPEVARIMADQLEWSDEQVATEVASYQTLIAAEIAGEKEPSDALAALQLRANSPSLPYP